MGVDDRVTISRVRIWVVIQASGLPFGSRDVLEAVDLHQDEMREEVPDLLAEGLVPRPIGDAGGRLQSTQTRLFGKNMSPPWGW